MERDTAREVALAVFGVVVFVGGLLAVSVQFGGPDLGMAGSYALVGMICLFLVVMAASGFWLSTHEE